MGSIDGSRHCAAPVLPCSAALNQANLPHRQFPVQTSLIASISSAHHLFVQHGAQRARTQGQEDHADVMTILT